MLSTLCLGGMKFSSRTDTFYVISALSTAVYLTEMTAEVNLHMHDVKMSRLMKLAQKFNCFYLTGKLLYKILKLH